MSVCQPRWFPDLSKAAGRLPGDMHVYRVSYVTDLRVQRTMTVYATDPNHARAEVAHRDPEYLATLKPPRIVGEYTYRQEVKP